MALASQSDVAGWLVGLDPIPASTLFVVGFALVCQGLILPFWARLGSLVLATATVAAWWSDPLYYTAGTTIQVVMAWGWWQEMRAHRRWLSHNLAGTAFAVSAVMLGVVWAGGRLLGILPVEPGITADWSQVLGWPYLTLYAAFALVLTQTWQVLRWIERDAHGP